MIQRIAHQTTTTNTNTTMNNTHELAISVTVNRVQYSTDSSLIYKSEKRGDLNTGKSNTKGINKNYSKVNNSKRNLIPRYYLKFLPVILGSQDKWNLVFDKVIAKLDELDKPVIVKEVKTK